MSQDGVRVGVRTKLFGIAAGPITLLVVSSVVGYGAIGTLDATTREAMRGAILDEQVMSVEIAATRRSTSGRTRS